VKRTNLLVVLFVASGCGAAATATDAAPDALLANDAEVYVAAYQRAFDAYEARVEMSRARVYRSHAEAEAVSRTLGEVRFNALLERSLRRDGRTLRNFNGWAESHGQHRRWLDRRYRYRLQALHLSADTLEERVRPGAIAAFDASTEIRRARHAAAPSSLAWSLASPR